LYQLLYTFRHYEELGFLVQLYKHFIWLPIGEKMNTFKLLVSVLMLVSVLFSACTPVATAIPSTSVPTVASAHVEPTFSSKTFKLPMSLDFNSDWQIGYDLPGKFAIDNSHGFGLSFYVVTDAKLIDPIDGHLIPFPEDFLSWIKSDPDFDAVKSTPVIVAGIEGLQIDATPVWKSTTAKLKAFLSLSGDISLNLSHGQPDGENIVTDPEQWRFILLNNIHGERLLIILIDGRGHDFQDALGQSQAVLNSVVFTE
jgi:hypothetical protein